MSVCVHIRDTFQFLYLHLPSFSCASSPVENLDTCGLDTEALRPHITDIAVGKVHPMDDTYRLKIKLGADEFEAEGPIQVVQSQFAAFKELVEARQRFAATQPPVAIPTIAMSADTTPKPEAP